MSVEWVSEDFIGAANEVYIYLHFMDMETALQEIKQLPVLTLVAEPKF